MTASHDQGRNSRGGDGGDDGVPLLVDRDLAVPAAPDLGRSKHAAAPAHVSEGTLAGTVGTATRNTGDTRNGTTGSPGFGGGLVAGASGDSVGLAGVLGNVAVDVPYDIRADRGLHDVRDRETIGSRAAVSGHIILEGVDGDERSSGGGCHFGGFLRGWEWEKGRGCKGF